jgi:hypothetical protein
MYQYKDGDPLPDANDVVTLEDVTWDVENRDFVYHAGQLFEVNVILAPH